MKFVNGIFTITDFNNSKLKKKKQTPEHMIF